MTGSTQQTSLAVGDWRDRQIPPLPADPPGGIDARCLTFLRSVEFRPSPQQYAAMCDLRGETAPLWWRWLAREEQALELLQGLEHGFFELVPAERHARLANLRELSQGLPHIVSRLDRLKAGADVTTDGIDALGIKSSEVARMILRMFVARHPERGRLRREFLAKYQFDPVAWRQAIREVWQSMPRVFALGADWLEPLLVPKIRARKQRVLETSDSSGGGTYPFSVVGFVLFLVLIATRIASYSSRDSTRDYRLSNYKPPTYNREIKLPDWVTSPENDLAASNLDTDRWLAEAIAAIEADDNAADGTVIELDDTLFAICRHNGAWAIQFRSAMERDLLMFMSKNNRRSYPRFTRLTRHLESRQSKPPLVVIAESDADDIDSTRFNRSVPNSEPISSDAKPWDGQVIEVGSEKFAIVRHEGQWAVVFDTTVILVEFMRASPSYEAPTATRIDDLLILSTPEGRSFSDDKRFMLIKSYLLQLQDSVNQRLIRRDLPRFHREPTP